MAFVPDAPGPSPDAGKQSNQPKPARDGPGCAATRQPNATTVNVCGNEYMRVMSHGTID
jgi:hypothetical protein